MRLYVVIISFALCCFVSDKAFAHIENGMPDSVAEMEYKILLDFEPHKLDVRNKLGGVLFRLKKYEEARTEFLTVLKSDPENLTAQIGIGQLLIHDKKWAEAENTFLKLQKAHVDSAEILYFLGIIAKETGKLEEAENDLNEALQKAEQNDQTQDAAHLINKINTALNALNTTGIPQQTKTAK